MAPEDEKEEISPTESSCPACQRSLLGQGKRKSGQEAVVSHAVLVFFVGNSRVPVECSSHERTAPGVCAELEGGGLDYDSKDSPVCHAMLSESCCTSCETLIGFDRVVSYVRKGEWDASFDCKTILYGYVQVTRTKLVHSSLARLIYESIASGHSSFDNIQNVFSRSLFQTTDEMLDPSSSSLYSREAQQEKLPDEFAAIGKHGISALLSEVDVKTLYFKSSAAVRAHRLGRDKIHLQWKKRVVAFADEGEMFARWLNASVEKDGLYLARDHCCTDCTAVVDGNFDRCLSNIVLDGVTTTPVICAEPKCCSELENTTRYRFCGSHFENHLYCGIRKGPNGEGRCRSLVVGASEPMAAECKQDKVIPAGMRLACKQHQHVEIERTT